MEVKAFFGWRFTSHESKIWMLASGATDPITCHSTIKNQKIHWWYKPMDVLIANEVVAVVQK